MRGKDNRWEPVFTELYVCENLWKFELSGGVGERECVALLESFGSKF